MVPIFIFIKCELGQAYKVATGIADAEIASEIYSVAGEYDLLAKIYVEKEENIGLFIEKNFHKLPGIKETFTIPTFKAF